MCQPFCSMSFVLTSICFWQLDVLVPQLPVLANLTRDILVLIFWALIYKAPKVSVCLQYSLPQRADGEGGKVQENFHSDGKRQWRGDCTWSCWERSWGCSVGARRVPDVAVWIYRLRICGCSGRDLGSTAITAQKHWGEILICDPAHPGLQPDLPRRYPGQNGPLGSRRVPGLKTSRPAALAEAAQR